MSCYIRFEGKEITGCCVLLTRAKPSGALAGFIIQTVLFSLHTVKNSKLLMDSLQNIDLVAARQAVYAMEKKLNTLVFVDPDDTQVQYWWPAMVCFDSFLP